MHSIYKTSLLFAFLFFCPIGAMAQSTPQGYCATVSGCEVLGIKLGGSSSGNAYVTGVIEYCRANKYGMLPVAINTTPSSAYAYFFIPTAGASFGIPGSWTSASLCAATYYYSSNGTTYDVLP